MVAGVRLHLVDGTYELYRAHFAPRPEHREPSGKDAKATVGIVESLLALLHEADEAVTHIAVAFDNPIRSFRNDLYRPYKSDEGVPPELRSQFDAAEDAVRAIGERCGRCANLKRTTDSRAGRTSFAIRSSKCGFSRRTRISASASMATAWCRSIGDRRK
jgi:5'-3' exonuclease